MVFTDGNAPTAALTRANGTSAPVGEGLAERHFTDLHSGVEELTRIEVGALDGFLRGLLFTDGTVTRALEVQTLDRVAVEVVEQRPTQLPVHAAGYLQSTVGADCVLRRVKIATAYSTPAVWAESHILADRLPSGFHGSLEGSAHGIGSSIQQLGLESRRELLWFGLGAPPAWAGAVPASTSVIVRLYRIVTSQLPALLISEAFAVERRDGCYHLLVART